MSVSKFKAFWRASRKYLFIAFLSIAFFELLENFTAVHTFFGKIGKVLRPVIIGLIFAYIINIPATLFETTIFKKANKQGKKFVHPVSLLLSYLLIFGLLSILLVIIIPRVVDSAEMLIANFNSYYDSFIAWTTKFIGSLELSAETTAELIDKISHLLVNFEDFIVENLPKLLNYTVDAVGIVASTVLAIVFSIYVSAGKVKLLAQTRRFIRAVMSEKHSEKFLQACSLANRSYRSYLSGQIISCIIIGIMCYIGMRIFNMPFPEMISVFIAAFALIPVLGPWLSTVPSALIILIASPEHPMLAIWFVVLIIVIQQIDNNLVYPHVVGDAVGLSSAWVLAAVIVGGGLLGIPGLLFTVPTTAVIYRLVGDWTNEKARKKGVPIVETIPEVEFDFRGHKRAKNRKKSRKEKPEGTEETGSAEKPEKAEETGSIESAGAAAETSEKADSPAENETVPADGEKTETEEQKTAGQETGNSEH